MKHKSLKIFILALVAVACFGCKKLTIPTVPTIPVGTVYTLQEVYNMGHNYTFDSAASVYCTVTADESTGNLYKQIFVQDSNVAMQLIFTEGTNFKTGDSLRVYLKGLTVYNYHGIMQLRTIQPDSNIVIVANNRFIQPEPVSLVSVLSGKYVGRLVELQDVEFQDYELGSTFADKENLKTENHYLQDCNGQSIIVRTSGYASFADAKLPNGKGSLVAIASLYNSDYQMIVRNYSEIHMDSVRCDGTWGPDYLLVERFNEDQGAFTMKNIEGNQVWHFESKYGMVMNGKEGGVSYVNDDWLISPALNLSTIDESQQVYLTFDHAANYANNMPAHLTLWVSTNYDGVNWNAEDWKQVEIPHYPAGSNWTFVNAGDIDLEEWIGNKNFRFAFRYTSNPSSCAAWEIKNVFVEMMEIEE